MASYLLSNLDLVQTNLEMRMYGQRLLNTFHWVYEAAGSPVDGPTALDALNVALRDNAAWYYKKLKTRASVDLTFSSISSQKIRPDRFRAQTLALVTIGQNVDPPLPQNVAVSLERFTLSARRGAQGRVQSPGCVTTDQDSGLLTGPGIIAWQIVADSLKIPVTLFGSGTFAPVLAHLTPTGFSINEVVGAVVKEEMRVMRRRTVGRGI